MSPPSSSSSMASSNHHIVSNAVAYAARPPMTVFGDSIGKGISGILHKWVNCGKGWRPRWFVLQDGVLSYYKIHGADNVDVAKETDNECWAAGRLSLNHHHVNVTGNPHHRHNKLLGEVHLKVSSIRESRSDDRRFSIFTGTKRLHLKANTRDDQRAWMEALQAVKRMFPRMSNSELMTPVSGVTVSTEKLRRRLLEEGVDEAAIHDSEQIMKTEFLALQDQLVLLRKKLWLLIDTLRML